MKNLTSEWLQSLNQRERKDLIGLLFEIREDVRKRFAADHFRLFDGLLEALDDEYHRLKR